MGFSKPLSTSEICQRDRYFQRHEDPLAKPDYSATDDYVRIGDEYFPKSELEGYTVKPRVQPHGHPFEVRHYRTQKCLDDLLAYQKRFPERKAL